jgi:16S rRNA (cytosine967-C5)-methyltransferase
MDIHPIVLAADIIQRSSRLQPADAMLRAELKRQRRLLPGETRQISRAVFAYFRWFGWLDQKASTCAQLARAVDLADRFASLERGKPCPREFSDAELMTRAIPRWLSQEMQITPSWVRSLQAEPKLWLRARPSQGPALAAKLSNYSDSPEKPDLTHSAHLADATDVTKAVPFGPGPPLCDIVEYRGDMDLFRTPEFHSGAFELQDISSQAVSLVCAPAPGETWWDACAGEGGKTLHLCDLMENKGLVWASDRAEWRLRKLKRRAARARLFNYRTRVWDGGPKLPFKTTFDGVLVDAPCSGIGTWQRNPHARWTTTLHDINELSERQTALLDHAAAAVKPGGKLIYAVCTLARSETTVITETFQSQFPDFSPLPLLDPLVPGSQLAAHLTLDPELHGGNGMFIAAWRRA